MEKAWAAHRFSDYSTVKPLYVEHVDNWLLKYIY
jgi:hypothetical protein